MVQAEFAMDAQPGGRPRPRSRWIKKQDRIGAAVRAIEAHSFRFAKTMASIPHEWVHRDKWDDSSGMTFTEAADAVRQHGVLQWWRTQQNRYIKANGFQYWTMGNIVGEERDPDTCNILNRTLIDVPVPYDFAKPEKIGELREDRPFYSAIVQAVGALCGGGGAQRGLNILDVGCGAGALLTALTARGAVSLDGKQKDSWTGVDPSYVQLELMARAHPEARTVRCPFEHFYAPAPYDLIVCGPAAAFLDARQAERMESMLAPGGIAVASLAEPPESANAESMRVRGVVLPLSKRQKAGGAFADAPGRADMGRRVVTVRAAG